MRAAESWACAGSKPLKKKKKKGKSFYVHESNLMFYAGEGKGAQL